MDQSNLPNIEEKSFKSIEQAKLFVTDRSIHKPRILLLYGSLRDRSFSRLAVAESAKILEELGAEVKIYHPNGLP